jgi:hypothetical protein
MCHLDRNDHLVYQIRVRGVLDSQWSDWFDEMTVSPQANGDTLLTGPVRDQSALHGILAKIRDLGVPLLSLTRIKAVPGTGASTRDVNDGLQGGICVS